MSDFFEMLSLLITPSTIIMSLLVVRLWWREAITAIRIPHKSAQDWFVIGVAVGFCGQSFDNFYWGIAWTSEFIGHDSKDFWFSSGVYSNVPARQISGTFAAYCHARSAYQYGQKNGQRFADRYALFSFVVGVFFISVLLLCR